MPDVSCYVKNERISQKKMQNSAFDWNLRAYGMRMRYSVQADRCHLRQEERHESKYQVFPIAGSILFSFNVVL